jgi:iron complex transport system substrate-binding protein
LRKWLIIFATYTPLIGMCPAIASARPLEQAERALPARAVTDETGRHMTVPRDAQRIVSLAPNLTEIVYDLGAGDRLVGDTNMCDTPPEAKSKSHVGNPQDPSLEAIVALHPDLVLATGSINSAQTADTLLKLGVPVYTTYPHTVLQMLKSISEIGDLIGTDTEANALKTSLRAQLDALQTKLANRPLAHVLFLVWSSPPMSIGPTTFIADALRWAGAESILATNQSWPQPTFEEILKIQPDYIVLTADHEGDNSEAAEMRSSVQWNGLEAVRLGRIVTVSDRWDRPSPGLIDAIEQLAHQLHPEAFLPVVNQ